MTNSTNLLPYLLNRSYVSAALEVRKLRAFVPCEVEDPLNNFRSTIVEVVFDPLRTEETNARFHAAGYRILDEYQEDALEDALNLKVIAVNADGSILVWGGFNSVFHLRKGEHIQGPFDEQHLAFNDIRDLINRFQIKNTRAEIDELITQLTNKYQTTTAETRT